MLVLTVEILGRDEDLLEEDYKELELVIAKWLKEHGVDHNGVGITVDC